MSNTFKTKTSRSSSGGGSGGRLKTCEVVGTAGASEKKTMPRQPDCASVSKTGAKPGAPRRRPNLQNPNSWQSQSSNRTARTDASGRPSAAGTNPGEEEMHI